MAAPSKAAVFRAISESRRSCNRFQPGRTVPHEILKDVLETSLVRFACLVDLRQRVCVVGSARVEMELPCRRSLYSTSVMNYSYRHSGYESLSW
jgi:hypothetical protein